MVSEHQWPTNTRDCPSYTPHFTPALLKSTISQLPHHGHLSCAAHEVEGLQEIKHRGFPWTFISYFIILLIIRTGMRDEYIHTSLVEKTYRALSTLYFSKAQKVGQIKLNFHWNSPKSFPMKAIIPAKCQFSNFCCRAIQIFIFKCFHKRQKYSFFFFFFFHLQTEYKYLIKIY